MLFNLFAHGDELHTLAAEPSSLETFLGGGTFVVLALVIAVASIVAIWKVFEKAGRPGWHAIVPFYNLYVLIKISGHPGWWFLLFLIPIINFVISIIISIDLGRKFGKDPIFSIILLWLLGVGYLVIAFDASRYDATA